MPGQPTGATIWQQLAAGLTLIWKDAFSSKMQDWYERYYLAIEHSKAYAEFCRRAFGRDFGQHGFADMDQVARLLDALDISNTDRVLDLGCGAGGIVAHIAGEYGVQAYGLDYVERAVAIATSKYANSHVHFVAGEIGSLCFAANCFDVIIAIDTLYFTPMQETVASIAKLLVTGGRAGILYSHGADPENPLPHFDRATLSPHNTPLAAALQSQSLPYAAQDLTREDQRHAIVKKSVLEELNGDFVAEGNEFLFQNRYGEALGVLAAIDAGAHARYQYIVTKSEDTR